MLYSALDYMGEKSSSQESTILASAELAALAKHHSIATLISDTATFVLIIITPQST